MTVNSAESAFQSYFSERGIRPETVEANGILLSPPDETYKAVKALLPAIRWNYGNGYRRYRFLGDPDTFPKNEKCQPVKAKAIKGSGNRLYIPVRPGQSPEQLSAAKGDPTVPIAIVEGEADTLGVLQAEPNALVVGISGCWGWKSKKDPILPELRALVKPGRVAILCPDSDWRHNPKVFQGWLALGTVLKQLGGHVQVVPIESEAGNKLGAGDYIHKFGAEAWAGIPRIPLSQWEALGNEIHRVKSKKTGEAAESAPRDGGASRRKPLASLLVELALELGTLWHDPTGAGWIDFTVDGNLQTARIRSKRFRDFLSRVLWERYGRAINSEGWTQATNTLEGLARDDGTPEREAFLRVGRHEGSVYIDLGTKDWRIVRVSPEGWEIIPYADCPIRFYRSDCQLPLPVPERGGSLGGLWQLLNFKESDRPLVLGWILGCLTPDGPKPILALSGEKGSGKSSAATLLKRLTDPTKVSKAGAVGDPRQVASAATGRWVLSFDNLTHLSADQQDLLCRIVTGEGFSHRTLYTDLEETFFEYRRPQILTGIDLVPTRSDLLDRCLIVRLARIPEEARRTEEELEAAAASLLPGVYGALLDKLVVALRNLPTTKPDRLPRMADFARLCLAAEIPNFAEAYTTNIEEGCQAAVEANPIAAGILSVLDTHNGYWEGTSSELIRKLQELDPANREIQKLSARSLGKKLASTLRGDLAAVGVEIDQGKGSKGQRYLMLSRVSRPQKATQQTPHTSDSKQNNGLDGSDTTTQPMAAPSPTPTQSRGSTGNTTPPAAGPMTKKMTATEAANAMPYGPAGNNGASPAEQKGSANTTPSNGRPADDNTPITTEDWKALLADCQSAGMRWGAAVEFIANTLGIPAGKVDPTRVTRRQYQQIVERVENYRRGVELAKRRPERPMEDDR
jgi:hypothetical protein